MTHEFKTPLATISLAVDASEMKKWWRIVKICVFQWHYQRENRRMNKQVETILQAALIDRQELQLKLNPFISMK
jgi:two-component system phosphate regulon sensor histidine kinase PhoR